MSDKIKKIIIVDDHPIMREGIIQIINSQADLSVVAEAEDGLEALNILKRIVPDLMVIDISLQGMSGLELTKGIRKSFKKVPILVLSMHPEKFYAERAIKAGALGYIQKHESSTKVIQAIRKVLSGKIYLSEEISEKILSQFSGKSGDSDELQIEQLSDREFETFRYIGKGFKPHQIAEELFVSVKTVETYYSRIKQKLNLEDASELRQFAINFFQNQ